jgi:UDP-4-amino-4,6-dideoxy-N-acetyl-beta-L-altrosamine N-acetyltransferase
MIIEAFGIKLLRLGEEHIELVRGWRNDPKINKFMEYRENITEEMQKKWFLSINNDKNFFYIIEYKNQLIGLTEIKKIDYSNQSGEAGIFIYADEYLNSMVAYQVILTLFDFAFNHLKLALVYAYILKSNKRAVRFNKSLGFIPVLGQEEVEKQYYTLNKASYLKNTSQIRNVINKELA